MKKLYSLVAIAAISTGAFAQGSESFTNLNATTTGYSNNSYVGDNGVTWTYGQARKTTTTDVITGTTIGFDQSGSRFVRANSGANGVGSITYTVRSYFTGGVASDRTIEVWVNGNKLESFTLSAMATNYTRTVSASVPGNVVIEFRSTGTRQLALDDVSWTANGTLAVVGADSKTASFIKNTFVDNAIIFGENADIKIYSMNGQLLKSATVKSGQSLDVSSLSKGIYIVSGDIAGQKISKKIIKK